MSQDAQEQIPWQVLGSRVEYEDPHLTVTVEKVATPARPGGCSWTVVRRKNAVVVAPLTAERRLVLVRQERVPVRDTIWEVPAGQVDELCGNGSFRDVAAREMKEETGYELAPGGEFTFLGDFLSSAGFTDERAFLFLASPVRKSALGVAPEASEAIVACEEFALSDIKRMIASGQIRDANTLSIFARLVARDEIQFNAGSPD